MMLPLLMRTPSLLLRMQKRPRPAAHTPQLPSFAASPTLARAGPSRRWLSGPWPSEATPSPPFSLSSSFLAPWRVTPPPFGFSGLGEFVFRTRYARPLPGGGLESWADCCERVVNGTFRMQQRWVARAGVLGWDAGRAQASAQDMFERMFAMKFLPPGRCVRGSSAGEGAGALLRQHACTHAWAWRQCAFGARLRMPRVHSAAAAAASCPRLRQDPSRRTSLLPSSSPIRQPAGSGPWAPP